MADENNTEIVETPAVEVAPPKKRPGPKPKKVVSEATTAAAVTDTAPTVKGRRKRGEKSTGAEGAAVAVKAKNTAKGVRKPRAAKEVSTASTPVLNDIADLLQLEEENARLRKALAEKLRAENVDLRKRLGLL